MSVSAGNLDPLLGALFTSEDQYSVSVQSYTTTGTGADERLTSVTVTVGTPDLGGYLAAGYSWTISAVDDSQNTIQPVPGSFYDPSVAYSYSSDYILGYASDTLFVSTQTSLVTALNLDADIHLTYFPEMIAVWSKNHLTEGTTITLTAGDTFNGPLQIVCFCSGTMIATPGGEVPVQRLKAGDYVTTAAGMRRRIVWIGEGSVLATRGRRSAATPVIVRKNALADNVPCRDLRVTKAHSLLIDGVLIPVEYLVNHRSIIWDDRAQEVGIYHIELETHDILIADGAPAESYRDDGNRWLFRNANSGWDLTPQEPCAPVLTGGPIVDAVWRRLLDRSGPRPKLPLTPDADLHLEIDGQRTDAVSQVGASSVFRIPEDAQNVRIVSRAAIPCELGLSRDFRQLGVAVSSIVVRQGNRFHALDLQSCSEGFHAFEQEEGIRWTDGCATIPMALLDVFDGDRELILHLGGSTRYLDDGLVRRAA